MSHPSWVCGLKHAFVVDKNILDSVTPFVGVWIETKTSGRRNMLVNSHTLRGCVD